VCLYSSSHELGSLSTVAHMTSSETWYHPLVEDDVANWSSDDLGRSFDDGKDPIPLLVTDKSNPNTVLV